MTTMSRCTASDGGAPYDADGRAVHGEPGGGSLRGLLAALGTVPG